MLLRKNMDDNYCKKNEDSPEICLQNTAQIAFHPCVTPFFFKKHSILAQFI